MLGCSCQQARGAVAAGVHAAVHGRVTVSAGEAEGELIVFLLFFFIPWTLPAALSSRITDGRGGAKGAGLRATDSGNGDIIHSVVCVDLCRSAA